MKYLKPNPKSEIRNSKEDRSLKLERVGGEVVTGQDPAFWSWGDEQSHDTPSLREDGRTAPSPRTRDLKERTARFGEAVICFAKRIPQNPVNRRLVDQLVSAGTSVGANFCEATDAVSGKDFKKSIGTCRKESKESMFFLRMIATAEPAMANDARSLWREAKELNLILGAIWRKGR